MPLDSARAPIVGRAHQRRVVIESFNLFTDVSHTEMYVSSWDCAGLWHQDLAQYSA
jgi:hypothetical protein